MVEGGLAPTRSKAVHLIKTGNVLVNGREVRRQSHEVGPGDRIELREGFRYVGRGGYKLEAFAAAAGLGCAGARVLDVGCSTGGFTDFFIQHGAASVVALDVGEDVLDAHLRADPRVEFVGGVDVTDAAALSRRLGGRRFDIVSVDVSNVPLEAALSAVAPLVEPSGGAVVALFKPAYEGARGPVRGEKARALADAFEARVSAAFEVLRREASALRGGSKGTGTVEVFFLLRPRG